MALKDLVAQKAKLTEETIEAIISDYVRYDEEEREIVFTSKSTELSNKAKILIFLVAQQGWQFILDEAIDVETEPSRMEELLGIPGGSLRPTLKDLKDRNLIVAKSRKYSIRPSSLDEIKVELGIGEGTTLRPKKRVAKRSKKRSSRNNSTPVDSGRETKRNEEANRPQTSAKRTKNSIQTGLKPGEAFNEILESGFFDGGNTLAALQSRLHERAIIINQTSLPKYLLKAVRDGRLKRKKEEVGGRQLWVYTTNK